MFQQSLDFAYMYISRLFLEIMSVIQTKYIILSQRIITEIQAENQIGVVYSYYEKATPIY